MNAQVPRYLLAGAAALLVLPMLEAFFFFVVSGGEQSVRGGFVSGHVEKYAGIWLWLASWSVAIVAIAGIVVLGIARLARRFSTLWIIGLSIPIATIAGTAFMWFGGSNAAFALGVLVIAALCGVAASLTFCVTAGVPWRLASTELPS